MKKVRFHTILLPAIIILTVSTGGAIYACNVPVFRYALERWEADPYEIVIFHRGELTADEANIVEWLKNPSGADARHANFIVRTVDLSSDVPDVTRELYDRLGTRDLPCLALRYPGTSPYRLALWSGHLSMESAKNIIDSPVRRAIGRRILDGESAVWVLLESGDTDKDETAAHLIESQIMHLESHLKLPDAVQGNYAAMPVDLSEGPEVRVDFSVIRLSRNDPAEAILVDMLMHTEPDLYDYITEPMAFPVYGRGRALYALVGAGITDLNIGTACGFLTGACSCEVKALNPGVDLLMAMDWESGLGETWIVDEELPPLVGIAEMAASADNGAGAGTDEATVQATDTGEPEPQTTEVAPVSQAETEYTVGGSGILLRNVFIALGTIVVAVTVLAVGIVFRKQGGNR